MRIGKNVGTVVCSRKDPKLDAKKLYLVQPLNNERNPVGDIIVAVDGVGSGIHETVFFVTHREAAYAIEGEVIPADAAIVGIVDDITGGNV